MFGVQALVNLAVAMAIFPTKGLTLPFVSYGGSSLLVNAAATGILLNVSRPARRSARDIVPEGVDAPEASALVVDLGRERGPHERTGACSSPAAARGATCSR